MKIVGLDQLPDGGTFVRFKSMEFYLVAGPAVWIGLGGIGSCVFEKLDKKSPVIQEVLVHAAKEKMGIN